MFNAHMDKSEQFADPGTIPLACIYLTAFRSFHINEALNIKFRFGSISNILKESTCHGIYLYTPLKDM